LLHLLKRHPVPITAWFDDVLVLTYALPEEVLAPLLPPGLVLDSWHGSGFVAIALVQTRGLRPVFLPPAFGQDFFLTGYRIFSRLRTGSGRSLRGLRILRSDTDRRLMVAMGNLLTHYQYRRAHVELARTDSGVEVRVRTPRAKADVHVIANLSPDGEGWLPDGSPFRTVEEARRFAGPLPHTFDYESQTRSIVVIKGVRSNWQPRPVPVEVHEAGFFRQPAFQGAAPILASAFHLRGVPYRWERGVRVPLPSEGGAA
jgi:uncharacterized protein YqjF (DUF2071 family)